MQKGLGRARPRTEERYNRGRGKFNNYGNCAKVEVKMRKGKGRDMDLGTGKGWVGELIAGGWGINAV